MPPLRPLLQGLLRPGLLLPAVVLAVLAVLATLAAALARPPRPLPAAPAPLAEAIDLRFHLEPPLPPQTLPPRLFRDRPGLEAADRDWGRLDPDFALGLQDLMARMEARGYPLVLLEGWRSPDRQDALAAQGAQVTAARAWQSLHQFGLAADLAPLRKGRLVFDGQEPWGREAYRALGEEARRAGFRWGGAWTRQDLGHVEAARPLRVASR
jgi:peptidoglycan LD-endopeptidase CwlK